MMDTVAMGLFWAALLALVHVYGGYELLLRVLARLRPAVDADIHRASPRPTVSVLLTVHNEQADIIPRLENLLAQEYPANRMDIVVASDGSDDDTESLTEAFAKAHPERSIRLVPVRAREGKSGAQNHAMPALSGEIVVLTDAATRFAPTFIDEVVAPFADPAVGCVVGRVDFADDGNAVSRGMRRYWRSEMRLRADESRLGILAVASGQAMAFRRVLFRPLPLHVGDDCIIPLDVVAAGARVVHRDAAIAYDKAETRTDRELSARARMTARNWVGTWRHPRLLAPFLHPGYAFALWSHKLMRWLSPVFLLVLAVTSVVLFRHPFFAVWTALGALFLGLAGLGWIAERSKGRGGRSVPGMALPQFAFAFAVAQLGFLRGLWIVVRGRRIRAYTNRA